MNSECVCGFNPPDDPNMDCERCQLIVQRDEARDLARRLWRITRDLMPYVDQQEIANSHPWLKERNQ